LIETAVAVERIIKKYANERAETVIFQHLHEEASELLLKMNETD
jgi:hypothetical protein